MSSPYELLLTWVSEKAEGNWQSFRQANDWLFNKTTNKAVSASRSAATLSALGHMEIDWTKGRWSAAPPVLTILPDAGAHALLTGGRTRHLISMLESATAEDRTQDLFVRRLEQVNAPHAYFIAANNEVTVEALSRDLRILFDSSVAERLSRILPPLDSYLEITKATPAPNRFEAERFTLKNKAIWSPASDKTGDGLYRYDTWGKFTYRFVQHGQSHDLDLATGTYAELRRLNLSALSYRAAETNGSLIVAPGASLPVLHARAAALCTGLTPKIAPPLYKREYRNVPPEIAARIAWSLGQHLRILEAGI